MTNRLERQRSCSSDYSFEGHQPHRSLAQANGQLIVVANRYVPSYESFRDPTTQSNPLVTPACPVSGYLCQSSPILQLKEVIALYPLLVDSLQLCRDAKNIWTFS